MDGGGEGGVVWRDRGRGVKEEGEEKVGGKFGGRRERRGREEGGRARGGGLKGYIREGGREGREGNGVR